MATNSGIEWTDDIELEARRTAELCASQAAPIFGLMRWTWDSAKYGIPTFDEIADMLLDLARSSIHRPGKVTASGRFRVCYDADERTFNMDLELGA